MVVMRPPVDQAVRGRGLNRPMPSLRGILPCEPVQSHGGAPSLAVGARAVDQRSAQGLPGLAETSSICSSPFIEIVLISLASRFTAFRSTMRMRLLS